MMLIFVLFFLSMPPMPGKVKKNEYQRFISRKRVKINIFEKGIIADDYVFLGQSSRGSLTIDF